MHCCECCLIICWHLHSSQFLFLLQHACTHARKHACDAHTHTHTHSHTHALLSHCLTRTRSWVGALVGASPPLRGWASVSGQLLWGARAHVHTCTHNTHSLMCMINSVSFYPLHTQLGGRAGGCHPPSHGVGQCIRPVGVGQRAHVHTRTFLRIL